RRGAPRLGQQLDALGSRGAHQEANALGAAPAFGRLQLEPGGAKRPLRLVEGSRQVDAESGEIAVDADARAIAIEAQLPSIVEASRDGRREARRHQARQSGSGRAAFAFDREDVAPAIPACHDLAAQPLGPQALEANSVPGEADLPAQLLERRQVRQRLEAVAREADAALDPGGVDIADRKLEPQAGAG